MLTATEMRFITAEEYSALMQPVRPPSPEELFDLQRARLADEKLAPVEMFDRFASRLPKHGLFLLIPPQPKAPAWKELMARVELDGKKGVNYLDQQYHKDLIEVPDVPTMLVGIEPFIHKFKHTESKTFRQSASYQEFRDLVSGRLLKGLFANGLLPGQQKAYTGARLMKAI